MKSNLKQVDVIYKNENEKNKMNDKKIRGFIIDNEEKSIIFLNNTSFKFHYVEISNITPDLFNFDIQVSIQSYNIKLTHLNLFKYVTYRIEGFYDNREFSVDRRYKEFLEYRKILFINWPGVYIPPIPPKRAFGNLEEGFIKVRKKFLQQFFNQIINRPHLAAANETKLFLESRNENYLDLPFEVYNKNYNNIYKFYKEYFCFLDKFELTEKEKKYVHDFYLKLNSIKNNLDNQAFISTEYNSNNIDLNKDISIMYQELYEFNNDYVYEINNISEDKKEKYNKNLIEMNWIEGIYNCDYNDSYFILYEWSNVELIEVEAMIENISTIYKYNEIFNKKLNTLKIENEILYKKNNPSWTKTFLCSIDLREIQNQTVTVEKIQNDLENLKQLIEIIYKILYYIEIPVFKKDRTSFYNKFLEYQFKNQILEYKKLCNLDKLLNDHIKNTSELLLQTPTYKTQKLRNFKIV